MKINSAIRAMFGITTVLGAAAMALPASAATVKINDSTGIAKGIGELKVVNTNGNFTVQCLVTFDLGLASGISTGVAYTIPSGGEILGEVTGASFVAGTNYCNTTSAEATPWAIDVTSVTSATTATVTIEGVEFYDASIGTCGPTNVSGTVTTSATTTVLTIPPFTMSSTPTGTCSNSSTISLTVSAASLPFFTLTYP